MLTLGSGTMRGQALDCSTIKQLKYDFNNFNHFKKFIFFDLNIKLT